jgi:hypothetical protein
MRCVKYLLQTTLSAKIKAFRWLIIEDLIVVDSKLHETNIVHYQRCGN